MEYTISTHQGTLSAFEIQFVGVNEYYPNHMNSYSSIKDCFDNYQETVETHDLDKRGHQIMEIVKDTINELRKTEQSFLIVVSQGDTIIFTFDDNILRRSKVSGVLCNINSSYYSKSYIDKFFKEFFKPMLEYTRYYSSYLRSDTITLNV